MIVVCFVHIARINALQNKGNNRPEQTALPNKSFLLNLVVTSVNIKINVMKKNKLWDCLQKKWNAQLLKTSKKKLENQ